MRIRTGGPADADEIVQAKNASWRAAYAGIVADEYLAGLPEEPGDSFVRGLANRGGHKLTLVAEKGPNVIGFATVGWDRRECTEEQAGPGAPAEVWAIYVHPDHWGRGAGYALMREGHRWLAEREYGPIRVWELAGNAVGRRFYERYGFVEDGERAELELDGRSYDLERLSLPKDRAVEAFG
ncbi:GNAT family N-acetyltransferase [Glycomyces paridis]|uniref:GNAT family N-acetyltransferase n=1 Tax=Glycomyces paridis TaxID=2126555 RepID=A0A4S8P963_9ACTN|nr:GNAT family N-acetyltransferase [Glycomyces paridis]THV26783.1 GNAT family N-acetyltransferase [Glycomyces paridis]